MVDTNVQVHSPHNNCARSAKTLRGVVRTVGAALIGLRGWLFPGRRHQPERRYMRGTPPRTEGASETR